MPFFDSPQDMREYHFEDGEVLLFDKPYRWTSFDLVKKVRYAIKIKKVGHAGTLDPLATGLLILCTGKSTKQIETFMAAEKEYEGEIVLGQRTASHDLETPVSEAMDISHLSEADIRQAAASFEGEQMQMPPMHSAIRVDGKRAYELARKGREVELKARPIVISRFEVLGIEGPKVRFRVVCSKGTYIRSLARDLGEKLGVGAYLSVLVRTRIGDFRLEDALDLHSFIAQIQPSKPVIATDTE